MGEKAWERKGTHVPTRMDVTRTCGRYARAFVRDGTCRGRRGARGALKAIWGARTRAEVGRALQTERASGKRATTRMDVTRTCVVTRERLCTMMVEEGAGNAMNGSMGQAEACAIPSDTVEHGEGGSLRRKQNLPSLPPFINVCFLHSANRFLYSGNRFQTII